MIVKLVSQYLADHKRLVIPNLGTFIVKVPGQTILFSNLIKADDGVLRSLLTQSGISEMEAAAVMDRFVFEAQYRLQNNGKCRLSGFGELRSGANGTITFVYEPTAPTENPAPVTAPEPPAVSRIDAEKASDAANASADAPTAPTPAEEERRAADTESEPRSPRPATERRNATERAKTLYGDNTPHVKLSEARNADYVKGLRYGKGRRRVPAGKEYGAPDSRRKSDRIMILAIAAAVLAIGALAYGLWCDWNARSEEVFYEIPQNDTKNEVRNPDLDYIQPYDK